uniref:Uncharacterized protein n=1 Tax=Globodera pallida TaxID=36090 RepID=A0A183BID6_GLOPA
MVLLTPAVFALTLLMSSSHVVDIASKTVPILTPTELEAAADADVLQNGDWLKEFLGKKFEQMEERVEKLELENKVLRAELEKCQNKQQQTIDDLTEKLKVSIEQLSLKHQELEKLSNAHKKQMEEMKEQREMDVAELEKQKLSNANKFAEIEQKNALQQEKIVKLEQYQKERQQRRRPLPLELKYKSLNKWTAVGVALALSSTYSSFYIFAAYQNAKQHHIPIACTTTAALGTVVNTIAKTNFALELVAILMYISIWLHMNNLDKKLRKENRTNNVTIRRLFKSLFTILLVDFVGWSTNSLSITILDLIVHSIIWHTFHPVPMPFYSTPSVKNTNGLLTNFYQDGSLR